MIISSRLDDDLYGFTMGQAIFHNYPETWVKYKFKCRNPQDFSPDTNFLKALDEQIDYLCTLNFKKDEILWLKSLPYLKSDFIEYLKYSRLIRKCVTTSIVDGELEITIDGVWFTIIEFGVKILSIISELYTLLCHTSEDTTKAFDCSVEKLKNKIVNLNKFKAIENQPLRFSDFGTRRRFTGTWHRFVIETLTKEIKNDDVKLMGTSNVLLAKEYGINPIGTMAHEWFQGHQQLGGLLKSHISNSLEVWCQEYRGGLGIALTDIINMDSFLKDFDLYFAKLYDGCRHDSGDPYLWCNKLINHYKKLGVGPKTKIAVFSDGLSFPEIFKLYNEFEGKIQTSFGIGTNLTNDAGLTPLKIVIKMVECNGRPVAKISDSPGKGMCEDENFLNHLKTTFNVK